MPLVINEKYQPPSYVSEGMRVLIPFVHDGKPVGLWCNVIVAAGNHARVRNERYDVDKWFRLDDMRVETPRGPRALKRLRDPVPAEDGET